MEVISDEKGIRIDKYLSEHTPYTRGEITHLLADGKILVDGKLVNKSFKIKENLKITLPDKMIYKNYVKGENIKLDILYEDDDIIVVNKPSGMVVHPGSGNHEHTLVNALVNHTNNLSESDIRPGIVHRIDKDTSGVLLVAKNNEVHRILQEGFKNKTIKRKYIALLKGEYPHSAAKIIAPIGRGKDRKTFTVTSKNSKDAVTHLRVLKRYKDFTLVELILETGRTHQIRVHTKYIGFPVYNDPVYTQKGSSFGQFLHAASLEFDHPVTKKHMKFVSDLPKEFKDFLNTLEEK